MEALSHSASLADLIEKRSAARWTGCSARDFAEAVVAKLEWRCKQQSFVADVLGTQAKVKLLYDRAVAANAQCLRGMEVQACEEYTKLAVAICIADMARRLLQISRAGKSVEEQANL